tara:strand:- start:558 stop:707 length:150 start_codon:yes stop_codon:yes gene_type:complete
MDEFDLTYELQKMAADSPDEVDVSIDENGDVEFEMDLELFLTLLKKAWR